ncbi:MAG: hypothetical protein ACXVRK_09445 [Gaiellaceae bacterium]
MARKKRGSLECISRPLGHVSLRRERLLVLGLTAAFLGAGCGGGGKLGGRALSQQSKALRSFSAEGALPAREAVSGRTTRIVDLLLPRGHRLLWPKG